MYIMVHAQIGRFEAIKYWCALTQAEPSLSLKRSFSNACHSIECNLEERR